MPAGSVRRDDTGHPERNLGVNANFTGSRYTESHEHITDYL
jgi:hypothetical protein